MTKVGGPEFVRPAERIATFDNDGTLWCEQPMQVQLFFLVDRVKQLATKDPALKERQPYKALLERDMKTLQALGKKALFELAFATHSGVTEEEFDKNARMLPVARRTRNSAACSRSAPIGRRSNCSAICARTASRPTSYPAVVST